MNYQWIHEKHPEYFTSVFSSCTNPIRTRRRLTEHFSWWSWWPHESQLQQSFHTAGVLIYVHCGSVRGAGQDVQNFILPFQLCLCFQSQVLQLHQHLHTHTHAPISTLSWRHAHTYLLKWLHISPQWTWTTKEQAANKKRFIIKTYKKVG